MHARSFYGGVADTLSGGLTSTLRTWSGINSVDQSLGAYRAGTAVGTVAAAALGGAGGVGSLSGIGSALTRGVNLVQFAGTVVSGIEASRNNDAHGVAGSVAGVGLTAFGVFGFNPCTTNSGILKAVYRGLNTYTLADGFGGLGLQMLSAKDGLDWLNIGASAFSLAKNIEGILAACFAAGTPLRTPDGSKAIEDFRVGDWVLSRDENDATGPVLSQCVEEVFVRTGHVWLLSVGGKEIRTTGEHPFFAEGHGWKPLAELAVGDRLLGENGDWLTIEALEDTGRYETVYNLRVSETHTYFVGCDEWGWSVWAHNADYQADVADLSDDHPVNIAIREHNRQVAQQDTALAEAEALRAKSPLSDRVTRAIPDDQPPRSIGGDPGNPANPLEYQQTTDFYRNHKALARRLWEQKNAKKWPVDENGVPFTADHNTAQGGRAGRADPLEVTPSRSSASRNANHDRTPEEMRATGAKGTPAREMNKLLQSLDRIFRFIQL